MRSLWNKVFGVFFGILGTVDFLSVLILYRMSGTGKTLVLKAFPVEYWVIKAGEMGIAFTYFALCISDSCNRRKTLALLAFLFLILRLISNVPLMGTATKITAGSIISFLVVYIAGMATMYNLSCSG